MKLISCDNCGLVYDQDKVPFAAEVSMVDAYGDIRHDLFTCNSNDELVAFVICGGCSEQILKEGNYG